MHFPQPTDEDSLLQCRIAEGDEAAFTAFYHRHWEKIHGFLLRMTKSREIAEELMCDIFTKLWSGRRLMADIQDMDAFLYKVSYNKALNFFRYTARQKKLQTVIAQRIATEQSADASDRVITSETQAIIQKAIDHLSPQRRLVFTLSREQGLTHEQIAEQLNLSPQTVKKTMSQALHSIRGYLNRNGLGSIALLLFA